MLLSSSLKRIACICRRTGDNSEKGTPVPIPNTEVKLFSSDDTAWATAWENRKSPFHPPIWASFFLNNESPRGSGSVVEHFLAKEDVAGSNPVSRLLKTPSHDGVFHTPPHTSQRHSLFAVSYNTFRPKPTFSTEIRSSWLCSNSCGAGQPGSGLIGSNP
jgi:hypothetical protein